MRYSWLLFDLDNTLLDFDTGCRNAFDMLLQRLNIEASEDIFSRYLTINSGVWKQLEKGKIDAETLKWKRFQLFFDDLSVDRDPHEANDLFLDFLSHQVSFVPNAFELIQELRSKYLLGIITNGLQRVQRPRLEKSGLLPYFETVIISEEIGSAKPQEAYFTKTLEQIGQPDVGEILVIGDSLASDIKGGMNMGMDTCWYNGKSIPAIDGLRPTYEIRKITELYEVLDPQDHRKYSED